LGESGGMHTDDIGASHLIFNISQYFYQARIRNLFNSNSKMGCNTSNIITDLSHIEPIPLSLGDPSADYISK